MAKKAPALVIESIEEVLPQFIVCVRIRDDIFFSVGVGDCVSLAELGLSVVMTARCYTDCGRYATNRFIARLAQDTLRNRAISYQAVAERKDPAN